jgi:hypothetical protein
MTERGAITNNITDELANLVLRINDVCAEKDEEIELLRVALKQIANCYPNLSPTGRLNEPTVWDIAKTALRVTTRMRRTPPITVRKKSK